MFDVCRRMNLHSLLKWPRVHHHHSKMEALPIQLLSYWDSLASSVIHVMGRMNFKSATEVLVVSGGLCNPYNDTNEFEHGLVQESTL